MKRKILAIVFAIMMIGVVGALTVGQIITQQQLNNANIKLTDLTPSLAENDNGKLLVGDCRDNGKICSAYLILNTTLDKLMNETGDNYYVVINKTIEIPFRTEKYYQISNQTNRSYAWEVLYDDIKTRAIKELKRERTILNSWKDDEMIEEINAIVDEGTVGAVV